MRYTDSPRGLHYPSMWLAVLWTLGCLFPAIVNADCECGYSFSVNSTSYVTTDILESDFLHLSNILHNSDWRIQGYNVSASAARGDFGESFEEKNVLSNPFVDNHSYTGLSKLGGDAGLQLYVEGGNPENGFIPSSQINSIREDMSWGSYRASIKLSDVSGTCGAFFWYFNDSQEIDMEFLSSQFNTKNNSFPVNLVIQSPQSVVQGYNAAGTSNFVIANLPFNPTTGFHEYRIDLIPGSVIFYADSKILGAMHTDAVPTQAGHLILSHWSNGNPLWSGGPPKTSATMTVSYVKSYFNSSSASREDSFTSRCADPHAPKAVCPIPDQSVAPDIYGPDGNTTANTYFFSKNLNMSNGQLIYHESRGTRTLAPWTALLLCLMFSLHLRSFLN